MKYLLLFCLILLLILITWKGNKQKSAEDNNLKNIQLMQSGNEIATFAGGCFWCTEAVFLNLKGVSSVTSGYIGGLTENPTYKEICTGQSGHAEAIEIGFDPIEVSFGELLEIFFATHDPTTLNRQGADVGTQYRSEVFYHNENQKQQTTDYIQQLENAHTFGFGKQVITQVSEASIFYPAEEYHKNYYNNNKSQGYCSFVITPKMEKLETYFPSKLKTNINN
ncbi:MAG: peptide-methionine (S)-S-oxide reductase [Flavobacterium sp.]|jgi:peptide-methionine (S)-S-oxide reductase